MPELVVFIYNFDRGTAQTGDQLLGSMKEKQVSTREILDRNVQDLIEEVNAKRKRDTTLLAGGKDGR